MPDSVAGVPSRQMRFRTVCMVAVAAIAVGLLVMVSVNGSPGKSELVQERLSQQHLMSQFSGSDHSDMSSSAGDDDSSMLSSGGGQGSTGWYGHWSDSSSASQPNWQKQLQKMEVHQCEIMHVACCETQKQKHLSRRLCSAASICKTQSFRALWHDSPLHRADQSHLRCSTRLQACSCMPSCASVILMVRGGECRFLPLFVSLTFGKTSHRCKNQRIGNSRLG